MGTKRSNGHTSLIAVWWPLGKSGTAAVFVARTFLLIRCDAKSFSSLGVHQQDKQGKGAASLPSLPSFTVRVPFTVGCRLHQRNHGSSHQSVCGVIANLNLATDFFGTHRWRDYGAPALAAAGVLEHVVAAMGRWGGATVRQYLVEAALAGSRFDGSEFNPIDI